MQLLCCGGSSCGEYILEGTWRRLLLCRTNSPASCPTIPRRGILSLERVMMLLFVWMRQSGQPSQATDSLREVLKSISHRWSSGIHMHVRGQHPENVLPHSIKPSYGTNVWASGVSDISGDDIVQLQSMTPSHCAPNRASRIACPSRSSQRPLITAQERLCFPDASSRPSSARPESHPRDTSA